VQDTQARYLAQRAELLAHPHAAGSFAQVSAFASLHVGVTFVIVLMASYYGLRRTTRVLTVFLGGTILATVYLGWHFAIDDLAGLAIGWVSVQLGRWIIHPAHERANRAELVRPEPETALD
jgi:membrane-associated phospholipid phosphatase